MSVLSVYNPKLCVCVWGGGGGGDKCCHFWHCVVYSILTSFMSYMITFLHG